MAVTPNYNFELIDFDKIPWHEREHDNWRIIDSVFSNFITVTNLKGVWQNALAVTVGQKYVDPDLGTMWEVLIAHTTPSTGTFAASRTATSANWAAFTVQVTAKGAWETATIYSPNDFVTDGTRFGIVQNAYTSGATYNADVTAGNIVTLVDLAIKATSTTSVAIAVSSHTFTIEETGVNFTAGDFFIATSDADASNYMFGTITSYSGTTLVVDATVNGGSGTLADWTIRIAGARGATGATGATGAAGAWSGSETVVVAALADHVGVFDATDSNAAKRSTIQTVLDGLGLVTALGATPAVTDKIAMADVSDTPDTAKTLTVQELFDGANGLTDATMVAGDKLLFVDADGSVARTDTAQGLLDLVSIVSDTTPQLGGFLDANSKFISQSQGANIASVAGDTDIWANFDGNTVHITGTNAITDFGTPKSAGDHMWVIFDGAASVVDSSTITVDGNTNFQAATNDLALVYALTTSTFLFKPFKNDGTATVAAAGGSWTLISNNSPSAAASLSLTGFDSSAYDAYCAVISNLRPATNSQNLWARTSTDGGSSYETSGYQYHIEGKQSGDYDRSNSSTSDSHILLSPTAEDIGNATTAGVSGVLWLYGPHVAARFTTMTWSGVQVGDSSEMTLLWGSGMRETAADVDGLQLLFSSGNIADGDVQWYGIKYS